MLLLQNEMANVVEKYFLMEKKDVAILYGQYHSHLLSP